MKDKLLMNKQIGVQPIRLLEVNIDKQLWKNTCE